MILQLIGCSHHCCSVELREQIAMSEWQIPETLSRFKRRFPAAEAVVLSTCNRTEIYTAAVHPDEIPTHQAVAHFLAEEKGLDGERTFRELFQHSGEDAIRHLFRVAASLDSMVVGEAQILSQVKRAYRLATDKNSTGQLTHAAFQAAIRVAKRVATETAIHRRRVSIPSIAIGDFALQIFERLEDKSVLLIGAGEMGEESLRYLKEARADNITIVNRHRERAELLACRTGAQTGDWQQLDELLVDADLVVSTTGSSEAVVTLDRFRRIEASRFQKPLFVVDLAVPRDFDPLIGNCIGVYLYSMDDLAQVCDENLRSREQELPRAQKIVEDETAKFLAELRHQATGPTILQLKQSAEIVRDAEIARLMNRLPELDPQSKMEIERSFGRLVNKLLHPPLESLKEEVSKPEQDRLLDALRRLFRLRD